LTIREAKESDLAAVLHVEGQAFSEQQGVEIVALVKELLRDPSALPLLSLLAIDEGRALGHILFTRAEVAGSQQSVAAALLAPLAVLPDAQSRGIGGQLIREGLRRLSEAGVDLVFVLGHPGYYPRYGFQPAGTLGFEAPYPIPESATDAWMVREMHSGVIGSVAGKVVCADALDHPEHWRE